MCQTMKNVNNNNTKWKGTKDSALNTMTDRLMKNHIILQWTEQKKSEQTNEETEQRKADIYGARVHHHHHRSFINDLP